MSARLEAAAEAVDAAAELTTTAAEHLARAVHDVRVDGRLAAYEVTSRFYEIGSPGGLDELRGHLESRQAPDPQ